MDKDAQNRIWNHRLHEDVLFYTRQNYFIVAESMLAVAFAQALSGADPETLLMRVIAAIGFLLTTTWLYVNYRQLGSLKTVHTRAISLLPEFEETYEQRRSRGPAMKDVFAYGVPLLIACMWLTLTIEVY